MGSLRVKFWGTRGLHSSPRAETAIFGGNTPCVQILYRDHLILVDTGFGVTNLGDELMQRIIQNKESLKIHIIYTHFHWDHIQGLPFFKPIYFNTTEMTLYSPIPSKTMLQNLDILFDGSYSPFESLLTMQARIKLEQVNGPFEIDGLRIEYVKCDHGEDLENVDDDDTYAYKFTSPEGEKVCLVTDHEARQTKRNKELVDFCKGADVLIHDAQYTPEEYLRHKGWGHSSAEMALDNAQKIGAGLTLLTHHDPSHDDQFIQRMHRELSAKKKVKGVAFEFAREEVLYEVQAVKPVKKAG